MQAGIVAVLGAAGTPIDLAPAIKSWEAAEEGGVFLNRGGDVRCGESKEVIFVAVASLAANRLEYTLSDLEKTSPRRRFTEVEVWVRRRSDRAVDFIVNVVSSSTTIKE